MITSHKSLTFFFLLLIALCVLSLGLSLATGTVAVQWSDILANVFTQTGTLEGKVISELRWPRAATAFITGGLLGLSGVLMQVLLRNPLADPYILGISGGAATFALLAIGLGIGSQWLALTAFAGSAFAMLLVYLFAQLAKSRAADNPLLLTGIVLAAGWGALINLLLILADQHSVHSMLFWLMGDLSRAGTPGFTSLLVLVLSLAIAWYLSNDLNLLILGDAKARTLGSPVKKIRAISFTLAAVCTAVAVSMAGTVGFIGLIIPHLVRQLVGSSHRLLIPAAVLAGGMLLTFADLGARSIIAPQQLPVGVITAMIGVPVFLYLLVKRH